MKLYTSHPEVAMAIFAHPDDGEVACGGSLAWMAQSGTRVVLVVVTQGDKGGGIADTEAVVQQRGLELLDAGKILGIADIVQLSYQDGEVENDADLRRRLVSVMRSFRPEVVFAPDPTAVFFGETYYNHRDHREVGWAVLDASFPCATQAGYFPEAGRPLDRVELLLSGTLEPNCAISIEGLLEKKVEAVRSHHLRLGHVDGLIDETIRLRASESAKVAGISGAAELFRLVRGGA